MQPIKQPESESHSLTDDPGSSVGDLQRQNANLDEQIRKLQQVSEYRSAFLARLAHELRTPLTSILGFSEILLTHEELTDTQRGFCERIQNSARQLQASLSQMSDLSRLEAGQSELHREEFSLEDLLHEACRALTRQAEKQNATVHCQVGNDLPMITSDRGKLRQAVYNFLAYAITRSPGALVVVSAEKDSGGFLIKIEDEGESPSSLTEFVELDSSNRRAGSSDLGLAIARQNIDLLGANLSFENREPRGLRVVIHLPIASADATQD